MLQLRLEAADLTSGSDGKRAAAISTRFIFLCFSLSSNLKAPSNHGQLSEQQHIACVNKHTCSCLKRNKKIRLKRKKMCVTGCGSSSSATTRRSAPKTGQQPRFEDVSESSPFHTCTGVYQESIFHTNVSLSALNFNPSETSLVRDCGRGTSAAVGHASVHITSHARLWY